MSPEAEHAVPAEPTGTGTGTGADPGATQVRCRLGVGLTMADGVVLRADCWWPDGPSRPRPAVMTFTPYGRDRCAATARGFASAGFLFVAVDCRGRGDSDGEFVLYGDGEDYAQAVQWLAARPECDGRVVTQGGSYAGINQWQVAARRPAGLVALAPMVAPMPGLDSDYWSGIVPLYNLAWTTLVQGRSAKWELFADPVFWRQVFARVYREARPLVELPACLGAEPDRVLARMVRPFEPSAWDEAVPTAAELRALQLPALSITGLFDNAQRGTVACFERHDALAGDAGRDRRFLVVGPSAHAGHRPIGPDDRADEADAALATGQWQDALCAGFYRWILGDGPRPGLLRGAVNVFVCGLERWVHAPSLEALSRGERVLHLHADGLRSTPGESGPVSLRSDPLDARHAELESLGRVGSLLEALSGEAPLETGSLQPEHFFGQGLHWDSEPLPHRVVLCGHPRLQLTLSTDLPDADLLAALVLLRADGRQVVLSASMLRLRHRDGLDRPPRRMTPGVAEPIAFPRLRLVARTVEAGSRLRLVLRVPASIAFERQMNAAEPVALHGLAHAQAGTITVHLEARGACVLHLPELDATEAGAAPPSPSDPAT